MKVLLFSFLLILYSNPSWGIEHYEEGDTLHIWAISGLKLRAKPDIKSPKIASLPFGESVVVVDTSLQSVPYSTVELGSFKIKGFWVRVRSGTRVGYVFDGYLSKFAAQRPNFEPEKYLKKVFGVTSFKIKDATNWKSVLAGKTCSIETSKKSGHSVTELPYMSLEEAYLIALTFIQFDPNSKNGGYVEKRRECKNFICIATEGYTDAPFAAFAVEKRSDKVLIFCYFHC